MSDLLADATRRAQQQLNAASEIGVAEFVQVTFKFNQRVSVHRPWWMPQWLYFRLMRSILIEQTSVQTKVRP